MRKINLLESTPKTEKQILLGARTIMNKIIARKFDKRFFHSGKEKKYGYGNYSYDGRWNGVVKKLQELYKIDSNSSVLDIGCAKGFLLYDLQDMVPGIKVAGIEVSEFAMNNVMGGFGEYSVQKQGDIGDPEKIERIARDKILPHIVLIDKDYQPWKLPYPDNSFDVVLNINTLHNLPLEQCYKSIEEMKRVCKNEKNMFIQVDAYTNENEKKGIEVWNLTALTVLSEEQWLELFKEVGYDGDYYWTIARLEGDKAVKPRL